jgi:tRNA(His) 5'-end guanylyltransferase
MAMMDCTALHLCKEISGTKLAFVQSDEISLWVTDYDSITTQPWFDYEVQKMCSCASSFATAEFIRAYFSRPPTNKSTNNSPLMAYSWMVQALGSTMPSFDARVFAVPDPVEVHNYFVWRQNDAERNALQMLGQAAFGHARMHGKNLEMVEAMLDGQKEGWREATDPGFLHGRIIGKADRGWEVLPTTRFVEDHQIIGSRVPVEETNETNENNPERSVVA